MVSTPVADVPPTPPLGEIVPIFNTLSVTRILCKLWMGVEPSLSMYKKSAFPKCDKSRWKKWVCNANTEFIHSVFEKSASWIFRMTLHIHLFEELFSKNYLPTWDWHTFFFYQRLWRYSILEINSYMCKCINCLYAIVSILMSYGCKPF